MNTLLTAPCAVASPAPDKEWIVGACPACGAPVIENEYHAGGTGYQTLQQCWNALGEHPTCSLWNVAAYQPVAEEILMETTLNKIHAALAVCDTILPLYRNAGAEHEKNILWFKHAIIVGRGGFCKSCGMPTMDGMCVACPVMPVARRDVQENLVPDVLSHYRDEENRRRDMAFARYDLIQRWESLHYYGVIAADAMAYCETAIAAERQDAAQLQEAA